MNSSSLLSAVPAMAASPMAAMPSGPRPLLLDDLLGRQPLLAAINAIVAVLTATVIGVPGREGVVAAWLLAILLAQAARVLLWFGVRRWSLAVAERRLAMWLTLTSAMAGLAWGAAGLLFGGGGDPLAVLFVPFVLAGMAAGSITALPGHPAAFFVFVWLALLPYTLTVAASTDPVAEAMALLTLLYAIGLSIVGVQVHRTLRRAAELHLENAALVGRLDQARQNLEVKVAARTIELRAANEALSREVIERRRSEERINHLLAHDPLTGLPNRILLFDRLSQALGRSRRFGTRTALMIFDIDRFKDVNDGLATRPAIGCCVTSPCGSARSIRGHGHGGAPGRRRVRLVAPDLGDAPAPLVLAQRAAGRLPAGRSTSTTVRLPITVSIGAALLPEHGQDADTLLRAADARFIRGQGRRARIGCLSTPRRCTRPRRSAAGSRASCAGRWSGTSSGSSTSPGSTSSDRGASCAVEALLRWRPSRVRRACRPISSSPSPRPAGLIGEHRPLGARRGLRAVPALARRRPSRPDRGQPVGSGVPPAQPAGPGRPARLGARRARADAAGAGDHRERLHGARRRGRPQPASTSCGAWACGWRSTISAPATRRWRT